MRLEQAAQCDTASTPAIATDQDYYRDIPSAVATAYEMRSRQAADVHRIIRHKHDQARVLPVRAVPAVSQVWDPFNTSNKPASHSPKHEPPRSVRLALLRTDALGALEADGETVGG
jgi:hypothetical protein